MDRYLLLGKHHPDSIKSILTKPREQYLKFARSAQALWRANFRDLNSSITRMATSAMGGRITEELVAEEISRLQLAELNLPQTL
ncbi:hypothetical protein [Methylobacter sp.]|uniref:hypothetical protein n=1 Tax=Methylobacter sp. TaxID=2051955 RepID=UPI0011F79354|nr:hypothetical protein [Methylobacter sp.]TAK63906.1 MAG: hypothetical protein EPO18_05375 [Methylobacter sp.]